MTKRHGQIMRFYQNKPNSLKLSGYSSVHNQDDKDLCKYHLSRIRKTDISTKISKSFCFPLQYFINMWKSKNKTYIYPLTFYFKLNLTLNFLTLLFF